MFLRAFVTSGLISAIYIIVIFNLIPRQLFDDGLYFIIGIFWSLGFFTVTAFVYGRKIKEISGERLALLNGLIPVKDMVF